MITRVVAAISSGWTLAARNIRIQMQEHALGYAWSFIVPALYAVCYIFIKRELSGSMATASAHSSWDAIRAFGGITLFQCWMQTVQETSNVIRRNRGMLRGLTVGASPFVLAILLEGLIALSIRTALIGIAIPVLGLDFPVTAQSWLLLAVSLITILTSAGAIGLVLAPWASLYGDVRKALQSMSLPLILISPIFYAAIENTSSPLYWINVCNPLAPPLATISGALRDNPLGIYEGPLLIWSCLSMVLIVLSVIQLRRQVPILLERLGN
jgi:ABC-type polysaccharide/polyol phosphate export permease